MGKKKNKVRTCGNCAHLCYRKNSMYRGKIYCCSKTGSLLICARRPSSPVICEYHKFKYNEEEKES